MTIRVERAKVDDAHIEATFGEVLDTCLIGLKEAAIAPINFEKTCQQGYLVLRQNMTFIARDEENKICGCVGMGETDLYYSKERMMLNVVGPFIRKDQRFGTAGIKLMRAVAALAEELDWIAWWWIPNTIPKTTIATHKKTAGMLYAEVAAYVPHGRLIKIREWRANHQEQTVAA